MIIPEATAETVKLAVRERSRYFFQPMAGCVGRRETNEAFVLASELQEAGVSVEPFWEVPGDVEGDVYTEYREKYPDFELAVRQGVSERLRKAQKLLPQDWQLVLKAGFRPLDVQQKLLGTFAEKCRADHPEWTEERCREHARTFVSDPQIVCPPHVTGGAVDVDVKSKKTGEYIDMGCPPNTDNETAFLHSRQVSQEQYDNRMILLDAMLEAGFAPNPQEWWHYQYGETYWAAFYGHVTTLYDIVSA